jgi:hypothetical protein
MNLLDGISESVILGEEDANWRLTTPLMRYVYDLYLHHLLRSIADVVCTVINDKVFTFSGEGRMGYRYLIP